MTWAIVILVAGVQTAHGAALDHVRTWRTRAACDAVAELYRPVLGVEAVCVEKVK